jgi:hypothetical protein
VDLVVRESRARSGAPRPRAGRGLTEQDFRFRGNKTGNRLRNFHENGLVRGIGWTNRTERARRAGAKAGSAYLKGIARYASFIEAAYTEAYSVAI